MERDIFKTIKAFAFDVDGVLTDGGILANLDGELFRTFDSKDGFGLRMASMAGFPVGIITGGRSESIRKRFLTCGVRPEDVYLGSRDKNDIFAANAVAQKSRDGVGAKHNGKVAKMQMFVSVRHAAGDDSALRKLRSWSFKIFHNFSV